MNSSAAIDFLSKIFLGYFLSLGCYFSVHAQSSIPGYPDSVMAFDMREVALLPKYCIYTQIFRDRVPGGNNRAIVDQWYNQLGDSFHTMHHYCWGLMKTNRALYLARDQLMRRFYLTDSLDEFDYVIRRVPEDFILLPEILTRKGENLILLGKGQVGILELEHAIELKPDYWPPYGYISDYYKSLGDVKSARETLERGLQLSPDAKGLLRRIDELKQVFEQKKAK